jgi:hypothetical protein
VDLHRSLRGWEDRYAQVVLVVPRAVALAKGSFDAARARDEGVIGDVTVLLDPDGRFRGGRGLDDVNAAVLLDRGLEVLRVRPPGGASALTTAHVVPLAVEAMRRSPAAGRGDHDVPN